MPMKNPPHPGCPIKDGCLDPLGLSVTEAARERSRLRTAHAFAHAEWSCREFTGHGDRGGEGRMVERCPLAGLQTAYALAQDCQQESEIKVQRYVPRPAA